MDENHQDKMENKLRTTENKLWTPTLSPEDQKKLARLRTDRKKPLIFVGISAAFVGVIVLIYLWFSFNWPLWAFISLMLIGLVLLILFIRIGYAAQWTGLKGKTLWDWLQLLLIPLVLTGGGFLFSTYQHNSDQQQALDQQQATILQTYIDNIQDLLLNHNLLGDSPPSKNDADKVTIQEVQELARSRTLTALKGLDPDRKVRLMQFIFEAHLIGFRDSQNKAQQSIIDLAGADLADTNFAKLNFDGVNLSCANPDAEYTYTVSNNCVNLEGANFHLAVVTDANFSYNTLKGVNFRSATLNRTNFFSADLSGDDLELAGLELADLRGADLSGADLELAELRGADLTDADLTDADLTDADLRLTIINQQQLDQVRSCKGAILPTGLTCHHNQ
jgi:uncharacterized protein YjbI with pentapeptide repeats